MTIDDLSLAKGFVVAIPNLIQISDKIDLV